MPNRVGLSTRLAALAIDVTGVLLLSMLFAPWVGIRLGLGVYDGEGVGAGGMMAGATAGTLVIALLWLLPEAIWGASAGKALLGLRIGTAAGEWPSLSYTVRRWALKSAPLWLGLLAVVVSMGLPRVGGWLVVLANLSAVVLVAGGFLALRNDRQTLHDRLSDTALYRRSQLSAPAEASAPEP